MNRSPWWSDAAPLSPSHFCRASKALGPPGMRNRSTCTTEPPCLYSARSHSFGLKLRTFSGAPETGGRATGPRAHAPPPSDAGGSPIAAGPLPQAATNPAAQNRTNRRLMTQT